MYSFTFNVRTAWNALDKLLETISPFPNWPNTVYPKLPYSPSTKLLQANCVSVGSSSASSVREAFPHPYG